MKSSRTQDLDFVVARIAYLAGHATRVGYRGAADGSPGVRAPIDMAHNDYIEVRTVVIYPA